MKKMMIGLMLLLFTCFIMVLSIAGPEYLAVYRDKALLGQIHTQTDESEGQGYRYTLSPGEKLYILSQSLSSYALSEEIPAKDTGGANVSRTYSFIVNHMGVSGTQITEQQVSDICSAELDLLKSLGILPDTVKPTNQSEYDAVLYSAIDVLEPRNNVAVWNLSLLSSQANQNKENKLIDAYLDADDGKLYEFYVRTELTWEDIHPDDIAASWSSYMGLPEPIPYEEPNPLMETTPYFKKYAFPGADSEQTIVTIGFYEGINELFLKISR